MRIEYFEDPGSRARPVVLTYGEDRDEVVLLRDAIETLVNGEVGCEVQVDRLPGFEPVDGCVLIAHLGESNLGVHRIDGSDRAFRCVLDSTGWFQVSGLLEPFASKDQSSGEYHQYLTDGGVAEWIISTGRNW